MFPGRAMTIFGGSSIRDEYSLAFDGTNEYIVVGDNSSLDITDKITLVAWIKPSDIAQPWQGIVAKGDLAGTGDVYKMYIDNAEKLQVRLNNGASVISPTVLVDGTWYHICSTYDKDAGGLAEHKLYINGILVDTADYSTAISTNNDPLHIGINSNASNAFFGNISEIAIYDIELSAEEVKIIYNNGTPYNLMEGVESEDLQGWWKMGDGHNDGDGGNLAKLISDVTDITTGTIITPNLSDNGDYDSNDDSNWTLTKNGSDYEWDVDTNTATSFGATTNSDIDGTATAQCYMSSANSAISANLPIGAYKITGTLATAGTLPAYSQLWWYYNGASTRKYDIREGDFTIYDIAEDVNGNHQFKFLSGSGSVGQSFTLSNVKITPLNGNHGITINMEATDFEGDTP